MPEGDPEGDPEGPGFSIDPFNARLRLLGQVRNRRALIIDPGDLPLLPPPPPLQYPLCWQYKVAR